MEKIKTKKIAIIVAISVLLFIIIGILLFIKTDFLKSNKLLFGKYLLSLGSQIASFNAEPYTDVFERINNEKVEIKIESESNDNIYIESDESSKIVTTDTIKLDNENFEIIYNIKNNDNDFFYMNILKNDNAYGIYIPELYDKYITLENINLSQFVKNLELEGAEEISEALPETMPTLFLNEEQTNKIKEILTKYAKNVFYQIDKNSFTKEKYVEEISGKKYKGNKYILTLSEDIIENIMSKTTEEIMNDEELTNVLKENVYGMAINVIKTAINTFYSARDELLQKQNSDFNVLEAVDKNDEETKEENQNKIKISLYEYKGKTIKVKLDILEGESAEIIIDNKKNINNIIFKHITEKKDENDVAYENIVELSNNFKNNNGEIVVLVKTMYNKGDIENLKNKQISDSKKDESNEYENLFIFDERDYDKMYSDTESSFKILTNIENNIINISFALDMGDSLLNDYIKFPKITTKFDSDLKIGKLNDENKLVINDYSKEDFKALKKILILKAKERYEQNADSLVSNYYKEILEIIDYTRERISSNFKTTLDSLLNEYKKELERNQNTNLGDFLSVEKIKEELGYFGKEIDEMTLITGNIMKVIIDDNLYFVQINIDGNTLELIDSICIYVEEELLATEEYLTENLNYQRQLEKTEKIKEDKEYIDEEVRDAIESILEDYEDSLEYEDTESFYEFLKRSNLKYRMFFIDEVELIDEKTIMCKKGRDTYFIIFNVDLVEYKLIDMQVFYSEDGTLENLR